MRLSCNVEVSNRLLPSHCNSRGKRKPCSTSLVIGFPSGVQKLEENLHILLCTAQNKAGTKYKVKTNVEQVFEKFTHEGRVTIRFKEPPHDVLISKADPLQLKSFIKIVRLCIGGKPCNQLCFPRLAAASTAQVQAPKTKLEIDSRRAYLELQSLPNTLTSLRLNNCELNKISERIHKLRHLKCVDFNENNIREIPLEIGLTHLEELHLGGNRLSEIPYHLFEKTLGQTLSALDLSRNNLHELPPGICDLEQLVMLKLSNNHLTYLPQNLWKLKKLTHLSAANNRLTHLPGTMIMLKLESIDVSRNPFQMEVGPNGQDITTFNTDCVASLVEWASRTVLSSRLIVKEGDIPIQLMGYLSRSKKCICGKRFVAACLRVISLLRLSTISRTVVYAQEDRPNSLVPVCSDLCSHACIVNIRKC